MISPAHITDLLRRLDGVDFVVIGGVATIAQAYPRFTKDLDVMYAADGPNLERLGEALIGLNARLAGIREDVPFIPDAAMLRNTEILTLETDLGALDLLRAPDGAPAYEELKAKADLADVAGVTVRVASIEHLLAMKRAAGRPQDLIDIEALELAQRLARE